MTIGDLIQIAHDEGRDPNTMELVIAIGGTYFDVDTADEQDRFNPEYVCMTVGVRNQVVRRHV